jgi:glycerophosphoryl diester phosphodiesterase
MIPFNEFVEEHSFIVCAHRGASGMAPENTMAAVVMALECGAPMVEIDVQYTSDRKMVVFHDDTLERTTNGTGLIKDRTYDELRQLDAGSWFSPSFVGQRIPALIDVLQELRGRAYVNIEIKPRAASEQAAAELAELLALVRGLEMFSKCVFSSFDHSALVYLRSVAPDVRTIALNVPGDERSPVRVVRSCGADGYGCSIEELTKERSDSCRHAGIPFGIYTVNTPQELEFVLDHGANGIVTNMPHIVIPHYRMIASTP